MTARGERIWYLYFNNCDLLLAASQISNIAGILHSVLFPPASDKVGGQTKHGGCHHDSQGFQVAIYYRRQ